MILETQPQLHALSTEEKMLLASELWDEAADESAKSDPEMTSLVGDLYREYLEHPGRVAPWAEVRNRVRESKRGDNG